MEDKSESKKPVNDGVAIRVRDLRVNYGEHEVLHSISFDAKAGETMAILGGSGSGKTTLLRAMVGLEKPTGGAIWIRGHDLCCISPRAMAELRKKFGVSFQGGALFGSMTVGENVALPLREHTRLDESTIEVLVRLKLEEVGLSGYEDYHPAQLSGGMKKRAAVARALTMDPEILFFDEPSTGLDPIIAAGIDDLILKLKRAFGMTIVVTHELASAFLIADCMVLIDKGKIIAIGTPEELKSSQHPRVRQFLDRVPDPEISSDDGFLDRLTENLRLQQTAWAATPRYTRQFREWRHQLLLFRGYLRSAIASETRARVGRFIRPRRCGTPDGVPLFASGRFRAQ
ncbi:MAG: ABC transporter ATP-binding protein [Candidatus Acidiferrales bacterium]